MIKACLKGPPTTSLANPCLDTFTDQQYEASVLLEAAQLKLQWCNATCMRFTRCCCQLGKKVFCKQEEKSFESSRFHEEIPAPCSFVHQPFKLTRQTVNSLAPIKQCCVFGVRSAKPLRVATGASREESLAAVLQVEQTYGR